MTEPVPTRPADAARGCGFAVLLALPFWACVVVAIVRWC